MAADDVTSSLLANQHSSLADVVSSSRLVDSIQLLDGKTACSIVSPHVGAINSLDFDNHAEGRFLLAGSADGTISVYDVGLDGSEYFLDGGIENMPAAGSAGSAGMEEHRLRQMAQHKPLARSHREPPAAALNGQAANPNYVPSGHGGAVSTVQWFNTDRCFHIDGQVRPNIDMGYQHVRSSVVHASARFDPMCDNGPSGS